MSSVKCDYCDRPAELVGGNVIYPHRPDLTHKWFWRCKPCKAYVGCHITPLGQKKTKPPLYQPLGRLANAELRAAKQRAHAAFDPLWKSREMTRSSAYKWAAEAMGISANNCHIGMFDIDQCNRLVVLVNERCNEPAKATTGTLCNFT